VEDLSGGFARGLRPARWVVLRLTLPPKPFARIGMGCIALLLIAEIGFVLWVRGSTIPEYIASRDPLAGTVYYAMVVLFAVMPLLLVRRALAGQTSTNDPQ